MVQLSYKIPVFIGRFQPLHKGHLEVMKMLSKKGEFIIVIGSMREFSTPKNPFTFFERREMIERALKAEKITSFKILGLPDINDDILWAKKLVEIIGTDKIEAYTRNPWPKRCLEKIGLDVRSHSIYFGISSTKIRTNIREGKEWKSLVHSQVYRYLREIGGEERINLIENSSEK
jgi:nicotinamide-nucleotide adenylyltransferase